MPFSSTQRAGSLVLLAAAALVTTAVPCGAADSKLLSPEGFLLVDGQPRLLIGSYDLPGDDAPLKDLAGHGFNIVRASKDKAVLDRLRAHGLYGWIPLGGGLALPEGDQGKKDALTAAINQFKNHPALLVWEAPDEALWLRWFNGFAWNMFEQPYALLSEIEKAKDKHPADQIEEWRRLRDKANDLNHRGLWQESEAIYDQLWTELVGENPNPGKKISACIEGARVLGDDLTRGWEHVRTIDPNHACWQNHAPRNTIPSLRHYNRAVDAAGCDIYPMPFNKGVIHSDLPDRSLSCIGAYTRRMADGAPGKAVWMVLQGFGWKDLNDPYNPKDEDGGRRPDYGETRFMAYDAIVHGAQGIFYWGTHAIEKDSQLWRDILKVAKELRALEPGIVGEPPAAPPQCAWDDSYASIGENGPPLMLRKTGEDWVLIAVNETYAGIGFTVTGLPEALNGKTLYRLYSDESHVIENGRLRDGIKSYDIHIYATSRRFEVQ